MPMLTTRKILKKPNTKKLRGTAEVQKPPMDETINEKDSGLGDSEEEHTIITEKTTPEALGQILMK